MAAQPFDADDLGYLMAAQMLVMARFTAFFFVSPFFGKKAMSKLVRGGLIFAIAMICVPVTADVLKTEPELSQNLFVLIFKELIIGFLLGILIWMPIRGLEMTGVLLDTQRGSTQAQDFDVIFQAQTTPTAIFLIQVFSAYFFSAGGFIMVLGILFESILIWPPTAALPSIAGESYILFLKFAGSIFFSALIIAAPISGFMLLADLAIAFVAKSAQTLNALTFGMPVKSAVLIIMLLFYMDIAYPKLIDLIGDSLGTMKAVFRHE